MPTQKQLIEEHNKNLLNILGEISSLKNGQDRLFEYIENNDKTGEKGMKATQNDHETRISTLESKEKMRVFKQGFIVSVAVVIGSILNWVTDFWEKLWN